MSPVTQTPPALTEEPWHPLAVAEAARRLGSDATLGLLEPEAAERLRRHGPYRLPAARPALGPRDLHPARGGATRPGPAIASQRSNDR
jgi:hypothetical protein